MSDRPGFARHAASEPETQAIQGFLQRVRPSLFIGWHWAAQDILYPWRWKQDKGPLRDQWAAGRK